MSQSKISPTHKIMAHLEPLMNEHGFQRAGHDAFEKWSGEVRFSIWLQNVRRGTPLVLSLWFGVGYRAIFSLLHPLNLFADLESSLTHVWVNGGYLQTPSRYLEWTVSSPQDTEYVRKAICNITLTIGFQFFDHFRTNDDLLVNLRDNSMPEAAVAHRTIVLAAAYWLARQHDQACEVLTDERSRLLSKGTMARRSDQRRLTTISKVLDYFESLRKSQGDNT